ncbi:hypothetical protein [Aquimarina agarivorans]|uniref:hypothetical protein n=1 Tax=Aquimarina agarivorans TaxID=980584 RepID=UPI000248EA79|nr:hypothetical protein [Aquimarina agarivorans]
MNLISLFFRTIIGITLCFSFISWESTDERFASFYEKEKVSFPNDLTVIAAKNNYTFMVSYQANKKREIIVEIWKGGEWIDSGKKIVKKGDGMIFVDVNMSRKLMRVTDYSLRIQLRPIGSEWDATVAYFEIPEVTVR